MPFEIIFWIAMMVFFLIAEAVTANLVSLWFAAGALVALIPALAGGPLLAQIVVFTVVSAGTLALLRPLMKKYLSKKSDAKTPENPTNSDRNIGELAICTERIDNAAGQGAVRLLGKEWTARTADGSVVEEGASVRVDSISGVKLIVSLSSAQKEEKELVTK